MSNNVDSFAGDLEQVRSRVRNVSINDIDFVLQCHSPYGFWTAAPVGNYAPVDGMFTSYEAAYRACANLQKEDLKAKAHVKEKVLTARIAKGEK